MVEINVPTTNVWLKLQGKELKNVEKVSLWTLIGNLITFLALLFELNYSRGIPLFCPIFNLQSNTGRPSLKLNLKIGNSMAKQNQPETSQFDRILSIVTLSSKIPLQKCKEDNSFVDHWLPVVFILNAQGMPLLPRTTQNHMTTFYM